MVADPALPTVPAVVLCAYKGANVMLRTAGYTAPIRHAWKVSNQHHAFSNLMYTINVCLAGTDGMFRSMGEGMICIFDGTVLVEGGGFPDEVITAEIVPARADEARLHWGSRTTSTSWATAATPGAPPTVRTRS